MEDQNCSRLSISNLLCPATDPSPLNNSSPTAKQDDPPFKVFPSSCGQAGSEWTQSPQSEPLATLPVNTGASFEGYSFPYTRPLCRSCSDSVTRLCYGVVKPPLEARAPYKVSTAALPQTTLPVLAPRLQRTNHAEHANTAVQVLPAVQAPEAGSSRKRGPRHEDGNGPFHDCPPSLVPAKKKKKRVSQPCDNCRQHKAKCDETKPCTTCKRNGIECKYSGPVPRAKDIAQADILVAIGSLCMTATSLRTCLEEIEKRFAKIESLLRGSPSITNGASVNPANLTAPPVPQRSPSGAA